MAIVKMVMTLVVMAASLGVKGSGAHVHHVVGGDRGWDPSSDVASWSSGRSFRVGDKIWFAYSAAQKSIVELKSKDEYESCDMSNPIRMYTDGLDGIWGREPILCKQQDRGLPERSKATRGGDASGEPGDLEAQSRSVREL